ncbi:probable serine/threonine-protein kinase kinX [Labrus bergylta]|uniref:probable serine/threonine-protein kinase kinX n=1 Tax=Labrus bergylta TaxID=56723 RepID=UPI0033139649
MAHRGSRPNPALSKGVVFRNPLNISPHFDTQQGRDVVEEAEEEDEEVELAEEVGEDVLMMEEAGEAQEAEEEEEEEDDEDDYDYDDDEAEEEEEEVESREDRRIIPVALLSNGVGRERDEGAESLEENGEDGLEVALEELDLTQDQARVKEGQVKSNDTKSVMESRFHFSPLITVNRGQVQLLNSQEDDSENIDEEEYVQEALMASPETRIRWERTNDRGNGLKENQVVSRADVTVHIQDRGALIKESGEAKQLPMCDTNKASNAGQPTGAKATEHVVTPATMRTTEKDNIRDNISRASTVHDNGKPFETTGLTKVAVNQTNRFNEDKIKNTEDNSKFGKQGVESVTGNITWQKEVRIEAKVEDQGSKKFVEKAMPASEDVFGIRGKEIQKTEKPNLFEPSEEKVKTEVEIEKAKMVELNKREREEEQMRQLGVDTLAMLVRRRQSQDEERNTGDHFRKLESDVEYPEKVVQVKADLSNPVQQYVDEATLDTQGDEGLEQVEEAYELEEESEVEAEKPAEEVSSEENESTTEDGEDLQEHHSQLLAEAGRDWGEDSREVGRQQTLAEDEKGRQAKEKLVEVEFAEEPSR